MRSENIDFPIERKLSRGLEFRWFVCVLHLQMHDKHYMLISHFGLPEMCFNKLIFMESRTFVLFHLMCFCCQVMLTGRIHDSPFSDF